MIKYLKIGYKNIIRHKRRTLLTLSMIISVAIVTLVVEGFIEDSQRGWLMSIIHTQTGHIQIMPHGYREREIMAPIDTLISTPERVKALIGEDEPVVAITERLNFGGMIATEKKTAIFNGIGIDPITDYDIFELISAEKGTRLTPDKELGCLIGSGLAKNLEVDVGNLVTLISNTREGAINAINVEIVGIFHTGVPEVDKMLLYIPLKSAQRLLNISNEISNLVILLNNINQVDKEAYRIKGLLKDKFPNLEVVTWEELATLYKKVQRMQRFQANIIEIIMFFLIGMAICIIMLMSVFERTREIGTMTAFGIKRREVIFLFLCESMIIGIIGGVLGSLLGIGVTGIINIIGIPFNPPGTEILVYIRPVILYDRALYVTIVAIITTCLGGLYPSLWASKIRPQEAFRFV